MINRNFLLLLATGFLSEGQYTPHYITIDTAPWQVSLQVAGEHHCGGSLISNMIILTAGRCFYVLEPTYYTKYRWLENREFLIIAGSEFKRSRKNIGSVAQKLTYSNIGIIKLWMPFQLSSHLNFIKLAKQNPPPGSFALESGWGKMLDSSTIESENLLATSTYTQECSTYICTARKPQPLCIGDTGGPLAYNNQLVGVFLQETDDHCTGLYTSVVLHYSWIIQTMTSMSRRKGYQRSTCPHNPFQRRMRANLASPKFTCPKRR